MATVGVKGLKNTRATGKLQPAVLYTSFSPSKA